MGTKQIQEKGPCPAGLPWVRVPEGYNCAGRNHWMADELVAEGKGGIVMRHSKLNDMPTEQALHYLRHQGAQGSWRARQVCLARAWMGLRDLIMIYHV
jgi:hypothetical protein